MKSLIESISHLVEAIELKTNGGNISSFLRTRAKVPYVTYRIKGENKRRFYVLFFFKFEDDKKGIHWNFEDGRYTFIKQETTVPAMEIDSTKLSRFLEKLGEVTSVEKIDGEELNGDQVFSGSHPVGMLIRKMEGGSSKGIVDVRELKRGLDLKVAKLVLKMFTDGNDEEIEKSLSAFQSVSLPAQRPSPKPKTEIKLVNPNVPTRKTLSFNRSSEYIQFAVNKENHLLHWVVVPYEKTKDYWKYFDYKIRWTRNRPSRTIQPQGEAINVRLKKRYTTFYEHNGIAYVHERNELATHVVFNRNEPEAPSFFTSLEDAEGFIESERKRREDRAQREIMLHGYIKTPFGGHIIKDVNIMAVNPTKAEQIRKVLGKYDLDSADYHIVRKGPLKSL